LDRNDDEKKKKTERNGKTQLGIYPLACSLSLLPPAVCAKEEMPCQAQAQYPQTTEEREEDCVWHEN